MTGGTNIEIREVLDGSGMRDWLAVPHLVHADDPAWVAPLDLLERQRVSARHNPFFECGEAALFVAYRAGRPVGRISAQVDRRHLAEHADETGFFGFFECLEDREAARSLVDAAERWLARRGLARMRGPFNLSINEDCGLLVAGFESAPAIMTSHAAPWAGELLEAAGLGRTMDLFAYRMSPQRAPAALLRLAQLARGSGRVRTRAFDMRRYREEVALVFDIFNDAWSDNWGFVPVGRTETDAMARDTRPFMRGKFGRIVEIDGRPAAFMVVLPDLNRVIAPFRGKLLPFNWSRLVSAIIRDEWRTARIPLLGVRKAHRGDILAPAVLSMLVADFLALGRNYNLEWIEFSWVLETNSAMLRLAELAAGPPCKTYRLYEKEIAAEMPSDAGSHS